MLFRKSDTHSSAVQLPFMKDPTLNWKTKGVLAYIWTQPKDWEPKEKSFIPVSKDGYQAVRNALEQLLTHHYLIIKYHVNDPSIPVNKSNWYVSDKPMKGTNYHA